MKTRVVGVLAAVAIALASAGAVPRVLAAQDPPSVILVWHLSCAASSDAGVEAAQAGLDALALLGSQLRALRRHPGARFVAALDSAFLAALQRAASGQPLFAELAAGRPPTGDAGNADLLRALAAQAPVSAALMHTAAGRKFASLSSAVPLALQGVRAAKFSRADLVDFSAAATALRLAESGALRSQPLLNKGEFSNADLRALAAELARADQEFIGEVKAQVASGALELAATPAHEPVLPLLVDAAGKSTLEENVVNLGAAADVSRLVADALTEQAKFGARERGVYSPYGAYDDATAEVFARANIDYALFSDRAVRASAGAGSRGAIQAADAAARHPYRIQISKSVWLGAFFWETDASAALSAMSPAAAPGDMAESITTLANSAARPGAGPQVQVITLRIEAAGPWARRPDRDAVVDRIAAALAGGTLRATTPSVFLKEHAPDATVFGFPSASEAGDFTLWMGSNAQASLWRALGDARKAAGGDAALESPMSRRALAEAESGAWFSADATPQPPSLLAQTLRRFRAVVAQVYRAAGRPVPGVIAPIK